MTPNPIIHAAALDAARNCLRDYETRPELAYANAYWCGRLSRALETLIDATDTSDRGEG